MHEHTTKFHRQSGVALLTALGILAIFLLLGTAYLGFMTVESRGSDLMVQQARTQSAAEGGIEAAIGEIENALASGAAPTDTMTFSFPVYLSDKDTVVADDTRTAETTVSVTDESARVNLNFAPRAVLETLLKIDRPAARAVVQSLPHTEDGQFAGGRWFTQVDDLVTRGFVTPDAYNALNLDWFTVYTVADKVDPKGYINLNTAPPAVLAAVFNVSLQEAEGIAGARPFKSMEQVQAAVGKPPSLFNMTPDPETPDAMPSALALQSRCFRLRCSAHLTESAGDRKLDTTPAYIEAVVLFPAQGKPQIRYWSTVEPEA